MTANARLRVSGAVACLAAGLLVYSMRDVGQFNVSYWVPIVGSGPSFFHSAFFVLLATAYAERREQILAWTIVVCLLELGLEALALRVWFDFSGSGRIQIWTGVPDAWDAAGIVMGCGVAFVVAAGRREERP